MSRALQRDPARAHATPRSAISPKRLHGLLVARAGEAISRLDAAWRSAFPLLEPEADEERPDCEHRAEHTEDDARRHQIGTSEGVYEEPKPTGEDQAGAELTEEEPSEAVGRDAPPGMHRAEGRQRRQGYVNQRDRHQLDAERLSALSRDHEHRQGRTSSRAAQA